MLLILLEMTFFGWQTSHEPDPSVPVLYVKDFTAPINPELEVYTYILRQDFEASLSEENCVRIVSRNEMDESAKDQLNEAELQRRSGNPNVKAEPALQPITRAQGVIKGEITRLEKGSEYIISARITFFNTTLRSIAQEKFTIEALYSSDGRKALLKKLVKQLCKPLAGDQNRLEPEKPSSKLKGRIRKAIKLHHQEKYQTALIEFTDLAAGGTIELGEEAFKLVRSYLYSCYLNYAAQFHKGKPSPFYCDIIQQGIDLGEPRSPEGLDRTYGQLLIQKAACLVNEKKLEEAEVQLQIAKTFFKSMTIDPEVNFYIESIDNARAELKRGVISPGDCITNSRGLQGWIGTVLGRELNTLTVEIKCANDISKHPAGSTVSMNLNDVERTKSVSMSLYLCSLRFCN
ncbi:hypothetical protein [Acanthopleuribacter pedis]|uniref:Uncharacterized protein n=1 Tax=Acanthopleuribacter pedis TaxID=442870 RepID=A0A8J7U7X5_9BACT|nr:hypothetical protein [Acanthopleuribacter pedis]MBO1321861.1 hypothetical protein [Acanthopleuribacter pedis]